MGVIAAAAAVVVACTVTAPHTLTEVVARPTPVPTAEPAITKAAMAVVARAAPPPAAPFAATLTSVDVVPAGNGEILGVASFPVDQAAVDAAVGACLTRLVNYLNAQFVTPPSRFTEGSLGVLLSGSARAALDDAARAALGQLDVGELAGTVTGPALVAARVVADGPHVSLVTLTYEAHVDLVGVLGDHRPLSQRGTVSFVDAGAGWEGAAADLTLEVGGPPLEQQAAVTPEPSAVQPAEPAS